MNESECFEGGLGDEAFCVRDEGGVAEDGVAEETRAEGESSVGDSFIVAGMGEREVKGREKRNDGKRE